MKKTIVSSLVLLTLVFSISTSCKGEKKSSDSDATEEIIVEEVIVEEDIIVVKETADDTTVAPEETEGSEDVLVDEEEVTVTYSYTVAGQEIKGSKTFSGHQSVVESGVQALTDSLKKIDPKIKIITN